MEKLVTVCYSGIEDIKEFQYVLRECIDLEET